MKVKYRIDFAQPHFLFPRNTLKLHSVAFKADYPNILRNKK